VYFSIAFYKYIFNFAVSRNEKGTKSPIGPRQYVEQLKNYAYGTFWNPLLFIRSQHRI